MAAAARPRPRRATARCPTTTTPSCGSPPRSAASPRTSGRASTSPRSASCSTRSATLTGLSPTRRRPRAAARHPRRRPGLRARARCATRPTSRCSSRATSTTSSRRPRRRRSTAASCPGTRTTLMATIRELAGEHVEVEVVHRDVALEAPFSGDLVESMKQSLLREDPEAAVLPYCLSGGTDNKALEPARHQRLRLRAAAAARRPRLRADVPRHRRARARRLAAFRGARPRRLPAHLLRSGRQRQAVRCTRMILRRSHIRRTPPS